MEQIEPILDSSNFRLTFYPIKFKPIYKKYGHD